MFTSYVNDAPFKAEGIFDGITNFGWYRVQDNTKVVLCNIMKTFFDKKAVSNTYELPHIVTLQNNYKDITSASTMATYISKNFPFTERKIPFISIGITGSTEKKMYIGSDNVVGYDTIETSSGTVGVEVRGGAVEIDSKIIIVARSPEERSLYAELLNVCFTHYYRWQYFFKDSRGSSYSILPSKAMLSFGQEREVQEGTTALNMLYVTDIGIKSYIEYTYVDNYLMNSIEYLQIDPDEESGPIEL